MVDKDHVFESVKRINIAFLTLIKEVGALPDKKGYVNTVLKIDDQRLKLIMSLEYHEIEQMADGAVPLLRIHLQDLIIVTQFLKKGNPDKAASLMRAGLIASCGTEEEA